MHHIQKKVLLMKYILIALKLVCLACGLITIWLFATDSSLFKIIPVKEGNPHNLRNLILMAVWFIGTLLSFFVLLDWAIIGTRALGQKSTYSKMMGILTMSLKNFLLWWVAIILINQIFIFGACFAPYCILAALPHTAAIALFFSYLTTKRYDDAWCWLSKQIIFCFRHKIYQHYKTIIDIYFLTASNLVLLKKRFNVTTT